MNGGVQWGNFYYQIGLVHVEHTKNSTRDFLALKGTTTVANESQTAVSTE